MADNTQDLVIADVKEEGSSKMAIVDDIEVPLKSSENQLETVEKAEKFEEALDNVKSTQEVAEPIILELNVPLSMENEDENKEENKLTQNGEEKTEDKQEGEEGLVEQMDEITKDKEAVMETDKIDMEVSKDGEGKEEIKSDDEGIVRLEGEDEEKEIKLGGDEQLKFEDQEKNLETGEKTMLDREEGLTQGEEVMPIEDRGEIPQEEHRLEEEKVKDSSISGEKEGELSDKKFRTEESEIPAGREENILEAEGEKSTEIVKSEEKLEDEKDMLIEKKQDSEDSKLIREEKLEGEEGKAEQEEERPTGKEKSEDEERKAEQEEGRTTGEEKSEGDKGKAEQEEVRTTGEEKSEGDEGKAEQEEVRTTGEEKLEGEEINLLEEKLKDEEEKPIEDEKKIKEEEKEKRAGDFVMQRDSDSDLGLVPEIQFQYSSSEEEEEEEDEVEEEEEEKGIDREAAIEKYKSLQVEGRPIIQRNVILLKKLAEHFRKRKMDHVYKTPEPYSADKEIRYHKQLTAFEEIRTRDKEERTVITQELNEMKRQRDELVAEMETEFDNLIQKEREISKGLINTRTGKVIADRTVEHLLSRQARKLKEVNEVRLAFIKLRDRVAAKEAQLRSLETFGHNLHLIDYEQLRMENQSFADKIEERDEELQRLRNKATSAIQIMAHMREKAHATDEKMDELSEILEYTETEVNNTRAYVTDLKKHRDFLRSETLRLRHEAGLLNQPRLLKDYALGIEEGTRLSAQVQNLKNSFFDQKRSLTNIRKSIDVHMSLASTGRTISTVSEMRTRPRKLSSVDHTAKKMHVPKVPRLKPEPLYAVTPELAQRLSRIGSKSGRSSRIMSRQSIKLPSMIPISKERLPFFPYSYKVYMHEEKKHGFPDLNF